MSDEQPEVPPAVEASTDAAPENGDGGAPTAENGDGASAGADATKDQVRLYLGNLSYDSDEHRLRSLFSEFGNVVDVFLPGDRNSGRPRGFGFVTFDSRSAAEAAIAKMDNSDVDGRTIKVNESRPRGDGPGFNQSGAANVKLYVGNLAYDTTEDTIRGLFEKHGPISDCFLPTDRDTGKPRGFAFVTMAAEDARKAMSAVDGNEIDGRPLRVSESKPKGGGDRGGGGYGGDRGGGGYGGDRGGGGYGGGGGYRDRGRYDYDDRGRYDDRRGGGRYDYDDRGRYDDRRGGSGYDSYDRDRGYNRGSRY